MRVLETILGTLLTCWILTWFNFDDLMINGLKNLFNIDINRSGYYVLFIIVSIIFLFFKKYDHKEETEND